MNDDIAGPADAPEPRGRIRLPHYLALAAVVAVVVIVVLSAR